MSWDSMKVSSTLFVNVISSQSASFSFQTGEAETSTRTKPSSSSTNSPKIPTDDNAEVTLNVCLGAEFTGGNLYFGGMRNAGADSSTDMTEFEHSPGCGILHRGQHKHGAQPIRSGERYNLIIWMRCSRVRNERCPMCDKIPDLVEVEGPGDGFTDPLGNPEEQQTVQVCQLT